MHRAGKRDWVYKLLSFYVLLSLVVSFIGGFISPQAAYAKPEAPTPPVVVHHDETGKVTFLGKGKGKPIDVPGTDKAGMRPMDRARVILETYGSWFGVQNSRKELFLKSERSAGQNHKVMRYQQKHEGIPVMGGEVIVNMTGQGQLISMNGEISPELAISVTPTITSGEAKAIALSKVGKIYNLSSGALKATDPELWIFDERLLQPSTRPAELVWRVEVRATNGAPVDELVLINAERGGISLHFNQVDTQWDFSEMQGNLSSATDTSTPAPTDTPTPTSTETPVPTATPTPVPSPTATTVPTDTPEPTATATPAPTDTPEPTATATPAPTNTPEPTATATPEPTDTPTPTATATPTAMPTKIPDKNPTIGLSFYVKPGGNDTLDCETPANACETIQGAVDKSTGGDTIYIAGGTYTGSGDEVVRVDKDVTLSGGWDITFSSQTAKTVIDGEDVRRGVTLTNGTLLFEYFWVQNGFGTESFPEGYSRGGGLWMGNGTNLTVSNSTIIENYGVYGGGIFVYYGGTLTVINSTISGNSAGLGGGISAFRSEPVTLQNTTISNNTALDLGGGGVNIWGNSFDDFYLYIQNTIIAGNTSSIGPDCFTNDATVISNGYNIIENISDCSFTPATGDQTGVSPKLGFLNSQGVHPLGYGSPAIDAGNPTALPGSGGAACEATDQLGTARPIDGDGDTTAICDIGAYETDPPSPPVADSIEIDGGSPQSTPILFPFSENLSVLVRDQLGIPYDGATVSFTAPSTGASGVFTDSGTYETIAITGSDGIATATVFTANGIPGAYTVDATVSGISSPAQFYLSNNLPAVSYFDLVVDDGRGLLYGSDTFGGVIHVISQSTLDVIDYIEVGLYPKGIDISPDGNELAVALYGQGEIAFIDLNTLTVTDRVVPDVSPYTTNQPYDVVFGRLGRLYVENYRHIHVIDTSTKSEVGKIYETILYSSKLAITSDNNTLYAGRFRFDITTDTPSITAFVVYDFLSNSMTINNDDTQIFTSKGQAWSSDLATHLGNFAVQGDEVEYIPSKDWIAISSGSEIYINDASNYLYPFLTTYPVSSAAGPARVNSTDTILYVSTSNGIEAITLPASLTRTPPPVDPQPDKYYDMVVDDARGVIYGSDWSSQFDEIDVISMTTLEVIDSIDLGGYPYINPQGLDISPDGNSLAVALSGVAKIGLINLNTRSFSGFMFPGESPVDTIFGRSGRLYTNCSTGYVCAFDTGSYLEVGRSSTTISSNGGLAITSDNNTLYVSRNSGSNEHIYRFDITTDSPVQTASTPFVVGEEIKTIALNSSASQVFTSTGQGWSSDLATYLGNFGAQGDEVEYIPTKDWIATSYGSEIYINDATDYLYPLLTIYPLSGTAGPARVNSTETILYVSTSNGIEAITLPASLTRTPPPVDPQPDRYYDMVVDDARGVIYGSDWSSDFDEIEVVDMTTLEVIDSIDLGGFAWVDPWGMDISPDGNTLAVALRGVGKIGIIDLNTRTFSGFMFPGKYPNDVVYGRSGRLYTNCRFGISTDSSLCSFDTSTYLEVGRSSTTFSYYERLAITSDNNTLYVRAGSELSGDLFQYDITTDTPVKTASSSHSVYAMGIALNNDDSQIFTSKGQAWSSDLTLRFGSFGAWDNYHGLGDEVEYIPTKDWIVTSYESEILINDATDYLYPLLTTYTLSGTVGPLRVNDADTILYVNTSSGMETINLPASLTRTPPPLEPQPDVYFDMVVDDARGVIYGSDWYYEIDEIDEIDVISMDTLEVIDSIDLGGYYGIDPRGMDISPDGNYLAVALGGGAKVGIVDLNTRGFVGFMFTGLNLYDTVYGRPGRLYTTCSSDDTFIKACVFDTSTYSEVGRSSSNASISGLAITLDNNTLFISKNYSTEQLYRFDITTDTPVHTASAPITEVWLKTFAINPQGTKVYTSHGQIWSGDLSTQLGSFTDTGDEIEYIDTLDVFAVSNGSQITFYDGSDYSLVLRYPLGGTAGVARVNGDDSILYVNTSVGIEAIDLTDETSMTVDVFSGSPQEAPINTAYAFPLQALVQNQFSAPMAGVTVTFTGPVSGASGTFVDSGTNVTTAVTDANGIATASTFSANDIVGSYSVDATVPGVVTPAQFLLENISPAFWYVSTTGDDVLNDCLTPSTPCETMNGALGKAGSADTIYVAEGAYTGTGSEVVLIDKVINLSGGWDAGFTSQVGMSIIDGENARRGITINSGVATDIEYFVIQSGFAIDGGGIYNEGNLTLNDCTVSGNVGGRTTSGKGGGIYNGGTLTIIGSEINDNQIDLGGEGGGIYNTGVLTINSSSIHHNHVPHTGGGIYSYENGVVTIKNTTISHNTTDYLPGGGISAVNSTFSFHNSTIAYNSAAMITQDYAGGGVSFSVGTSATLYNTIIAENESGEEAFASQDCRQLSIGIIVSGGYNLIGSNCNITPTTGDIFDTSSKLIPGLVGYPGVNPLYNDSPAIDAGDPATPGTCEVVDQRGIARPIDGDGVGGAQCDIGAFEYSGTGTVPAYVFIYEGTPQIAMMGMSFSAPLKVFVADDLGQGVTGASVTFTAPASGPSGTFSGGGGNEVVLTDAYGVATSSTFTANDILGEYIVEATIPGIPTPADFDLRNTLSYETYTANNGTTLPGTLLCTQYEPDCTSGSGSHSKSAHLYAYDTAYFYFSQHGRNSIDNAGMTIISSVHYASGYNNAFWDGSQLVYGDGAGYPLADDVVGHEYTHGVTDYTSDLFYYYQSGAIDESFSDLWGEFVDLTNGAGDDSSGVRWKIGEDVTGLGAIRDMQNPADPLYNDPDKMTSALYHLGNDDARPFDNGGVHTNSGVNNKAVYLMVDGDVFNGYSVGGIGIPKVAAIYYEAQTMLTSGADYKDLYYALQQACANRLWGAEGITADDCVEVKKALDAVEMNYEPVLGFNPEAELCPAGKGPMDIFFDDFESGFANWVTGGIPDIVWGGATGYATSGTTSLYGFDAPGYDSYVELTLDVPIPATGGAYLHFNHAFGFEDEDYDGGWLEYSTDGGVNWLDAGALDWDGLGYNGAINPNPIYGNPNPGHPAFIADSHGYVSSKLNLPSSLNQVRFRWRLSTDSTIRDFGWVIDDVRIYTCGDPTFADVPFDHPFYDYIMALWENGLTAGCQDNPLLLYCPDQILNRAMTAVFMLRGEFGDIYSPPDPPEGIFHDDWLQPTDISWAEKWAEGLYAAEMTAGCQTNPELLYCPRTQLNRVQAAVFGLNMKFGVTYTPPPASGDIFADMTDAGFWGTKWAEQAYLNGLLPGCGWDSVSGKPLFCPFEFVNRAWAAYLIVEAKDLLP